MKPMVAALLALLLLASASLVLVAQPPSDPLAPFRAPDGSLHIPGNALTPELQRLLFGGSDLQPEYNLTFLIPERSPYPTLHPIPVYVKVPNLNVFAHSGREPITWGDALGHLLQKWFPPVDWSTVLSEIQSTIQRSLSGFFSLFTWSARADTLSVDSTTTTVVEPAAATCTTTQSAAAGDNGILVMLSNRPATAYASVTYGSVSLSLVPGTASSGTGIVRAEIWFYQGAIPAGSQTMTATLSTGTAKQVCATVLLQGVANTGSTTGGTSASAISTNPTIAIAPAAGQLAFAVASIRGTTAPTAVTGTGATATSLYGIAPRRCTAAGTNLCGAGAYMPNPGTAITWTDAAATDWVVSAVRVVPAPNCSAGGGNCYRIGAGGAWNTAANWSNTASGASCGCTPAATDNAIFNAVPTGTTTLAAATTIASIDMTGFTGTLDTVAGSNWALTVNGLFKIQGTVMARNSSVAVTGHVTVLTAGTVVNLGGSTWTVSGGWTNLSTSAAWVAGTSTVTIRESASDTLTFAALTGPTNEFNNLILDTTALGGITYTMTANALYCGGLLTIRNSTGGATGNTVLDTSGLGVTTAGITIGTNGTLTANASTITVNGSWTSTAANATWNRGTSAVTFGATGTITLSAAQSFYTMTQSTGTSTLGAALTVAALLTVNGTLSTSGNNYSLTAQAGLTIGGVLVTGTSTVAETGNVNIAAATGYVTSGAGGSWTVTNGSWTNASTSGSWSFAAPITFRSNVNQTMIFAGTNLAGSEFAGTVTFDAGAVTGALYTLATRGLVTGSTLTIRNSTGGATGYTIVDSSASNLPVTAGSLTLGTFGEFNSRSSSITVNGPVSIGAANAFVTNAGGSWTVSGSWTNSTTSGSWGFAALLRFSSGAAQTMTFKASATEFGGAVTFDSTVAAGVTYTMATNALTLSGLLTIQNTAGGATGNTILTTSAGNLGITAGSLTLGTRGTLTANGSTINVGGNWTVTAANATFTAGTSTVVFTAAAIVNMTQSFNNLTVSAGTATLAANTTVGAALVVSGGTLAKSTFTLAAATLTLSGGALTSTSGNGTVTGNVSISSAASYFAFGSETWTIGGSWTNSSTSASWSPGTGTVVFNAGAARTMTFGALPVAEFNNVQLSPTAAATFTMAANGLRWSGTLTLNNNATLSTANLALNGGNLTVNNGSTLSAGSSTVNVANVTMTGGASGSIVLTAGVWAVTGSWNTSGAGSVFTKGTSTITLSGTAQTVAILNPANGFYNLTVSGTITQGGAIDVTNTLSVAGTLTTSNNNITGASSLTVTATGTLVAGSSSLTIRSMNTSAAGATFTVGTSTIIVGMSGGTVNVPQTVYNLTVSSGVATTFTSNITWSAALTLTSAAPTFAGNLTSSGAATITLGSATISIGGSWNTTSATSWTAASSTVTFTGAAATLTVAAAQAFATLTFSGSTTLGSNITATSLTVSGASTLTKTGYSIAFNALTVNATGVLGDGSVNVQSFTVTDNDATALITISSFTAWTVNNSFGWSHADNRTTDTITFTIGGNTPANRWSVLKNGAAFTSGTVNGSGQVVFSMLGSDPSILVTISPACGANRYWVLGSGNWSDTSHWASVSGGAFGCAVPTSASAVIFDANSGSGTATVNANAAMASLNTTGSSLGTIAIGTFDFAVSGNVTHAAGSITMGASAGTGFSITGGLTLSGNASLSMAGASKGSVTGNVNIASATAFIAFGSGAWTMSGSWTNASTSASWSAGTATVTFNSSGNQTMTFAGSNLSSNEFLAVVFNSGASTVTYTMSARALNAGAVTVQGGTGTTTLSTSGSNLAITTTTLTVASGGSLTANGSTLTVVSMNSSAGSFTTGTSTVLVNASGGTINVPQALFNVTVNASVSTTVASNLTWSGTLTLTSSTVAFSGNLTASGTGANALFGSAVVTIAGNWDTSSVTTGAFTSTSSSVTFTGAGRTIRISGSQSFAGVTVSGTISQLSQLTTTGNLTLATGSSLATSSNALSVQGALTINGTGFLATGTSTVLVIGSVSIASATAYVTSGAGSWTVSSSWTNNSTSGSWSFLAPITFNASASQTMTFANLAQEFGGSLTFDSGASTATFTMGANALRWAGTLTIAGGAGTTTLATSNLGLTGGALVIGNGGILTANVSTVSVSGVTMTGGTSGILTVTTGTWTIAGNWNTTGLGSVWNPGAASSYTFSATGSIATLAAQSTFPILTVSGGTVTLANGLTVTGALTLTGGVLAKGTNALTASSLAMGGGSLTSSSGDATINGNVAITSPSSYIAFGSETWTIAGTWTNASTSAAWSPGTGSVVFTSPSGGTMTFAALPGGAPEFHNVTFDAGAASATFAMVTNALVWTGSLTVQGGTGTTTLDTGSLGLSGGSLAIGDSGVLNAGASSVAVSSVSMVGGSSGQVTLTSGTWTVSGNWNTSGAGATMASGTSTVIFSGSSATIQLAPGQEFYNLSVNGTLSLASMVTASAVLTVNNGAVLTMTGQSIAFNGLIENGSGSIVDGSVVVVNLTVANSDSSNITTISVFSIWIVDAEYNWADASTVGTSTLTFTIDGNTVGNRFNVTKDGSSFTTGNVNASGQVVFTMLGSDPVIDVLVLSPCGTSRYWVGGTGNWSESVHWASASGGVGGCTIPNAADSVFFDGAAGNGTVTLDQDATAIALNTVGWAGTIAVGTFALTISGSLALAGGTLSIGASATTGLSVGGSLTLSGSAILDGSAGASTVTVGGDVAITSSTAYLRMGSGTWTFQGSWSNASTSANWAPGTGTVVFASGTSQTMSFAGFAGSEFNNITFTSTGAGAVTFTLGTNGLKWAGTLTIQDAAGSTTLATANLALVGGSTVVGNSGILLANASAVTVIDVTMTSGTSGTITVTTGSWTVRGTWNTSGAGSTFTKGTGTVTLSGTSQTVSLRDAAHGFYNLAISGTVTEASAIDVAGTLTITGILTTAGNGITGGANLIISGGGSLVGSTAAIAVSTVTMNDASANTLSLTTGSMSVSGSWDTTGASSVFTPGASTVALTASGSVALGAGQTFASLIVSGDFTLATQLSASSLTVTAGTLGKGTHPLTLSGDFTLSGGSMTSVSGDVAIGGNATISAATSYISFGSETWSIGGAWTNGSTSASWSAGTGTVIFNSTSSLTMTFAGTNLAANEFENVVFSGGASTVTFTMAGPALWAHAVTIRGGPGATTLDTSSSNAAITADTLTVGVGGILVANASTLTLQSMDTSAGNFVAGASTVVVDASGGLLRVPQPIHSLTVTPGVTTTFASNVTWSAALTLTGATVAFQGNLGSGAAASLDFATGTITIAGSWDTSLMGAFTSTGSSVTFIGLGQTLALGTGQQFAALIIAGNVALNSDAAATTLTIPTGGALTKTSHAIGFNSLAVSGTITDGSVNVTNLTVTNSDGTAIVTISAFSVWNAGAEYAWTHTSSETNQTITWTLLGNPSRLLFHVTKDGSPFADGTVDDSGSIVFTMLGSDPAIRVTVAAPAGIAWWQSPYFLAALPLPFLVVIAMFVQRRRWRPAKAFLVDERGQLLREFTLDPSCEVSYDEARQAGALDAIEKDIRVGKYHARAVRGDMLALIMLAVGPANIQEVEFARGLLVSIQDKLDDTVKERIEEVRAGEASLGAARAHDSDERANLQTRARVFGDMVNAFTVAHTKLDADSQRLRQMDANLREREDNLAEVRVSLEQQEARAKSREEELEREEADLKARQAQVEETDKTLRQRENDIGPKEEALGNRTQEASRVETELANREAALAVAQARLATDVESCQIKTTHAESLQAELADERKALEDLRGQMDEQQQVLTERTTSVEEREKEVAEKTEELGTKLAGLEPREQDLGKREAALVERETACAKKDEVLTTREGQLRAQLDDLNAREAKLAAQAQDLAEDRKAVDALTGEVTESRKALDQKVAEFAKREADIAARTRDLVDLKENLGPREAALFEKETDLGSREKVLADERRAFQSTQDLVAAKALEIQQQMEQIKARETELGQEKTFLEDAKGAFEEQQRGFEARKSDFAKEIQRQQADLATQDNALGEARLRLTKDAESFEALRLEKSQWIATKEIELEAKEQSLVDREAEIRAQAEENARHLAELAAREEAVEIDGDKLDKARAELETRKAELGAMARDLEAKTVKFRDEESQKGEELRTWQATLESEQALLKEQRETFEKEMQEVRESWAGRMIRVEQREEELQQRETKVQADVEWVGRNEIELSKREEAAAENLKTATELQAQGERLRKELEQRAMEVESRERDLHEEAAEQSVALEKRMEALQAREAELAGQKAQRERELANQLQKMQEREADAQARKETLDAHETNLASREQTLLDQQGALRQDEDRLAREKADLVAMEKHVEATQLEHAQMRERLDAESQRLSAEADAIRKSLAAKEADLTSERERLERESSALQEKLGGKAKEMATREKAVTAREVELRAEEQEVDARLREIESRERQADAHLAELNARTEALAQSETEQRARRAAFDDAVRKFDAEAAARQKEWQDLQATLKSQEAQLAASTETRHAEIRKRMEDMEQRERSINAALTQGQIERTHLEAQAKAQAAKQTEVDAAAARADKRFGELKGMEEELLKARQAFEAERGAWSARRSEELKQLEATRDAAAEQTQQAERLIEDSQRRAYVAAEAEKAAKRQGEELTATQSSIEKRRADAEKAEKDLEAQTAALREASKRLGAQELELASKAKDLEALQARLADADRRNAETAETLKGRKASLEEQAERVASLAAQSDRRQAEIETRNAAVEAKLDEATKREQVLSTELQRADNLMEDLNRKENEIEVREKTFAGREQDLGKREQMLAQRDSELRDGMQTLERLRRENETRTVQAEQDRQAAAEARREANALRAEAEKLKTQADAMQAEVAKNMRFLQKKALDVLDREEKTRAREAKVDEQNHLLESRAQILEEKDRVFDAEKEELTGRLEKAKQENEKLKARLAEAEKAGKGAIDMEEWKRDMDNRVKIIQKKALDLLDREEKLRKKEEELRSLAAQLGVEAKS